MNIDWLLRFFKKYRLNRQYKSISAVNSKLIESNNLLCELLELTDDKGLSATIDYFHKICAYKLQTHSKNIVELTTLLSVLSARLSDRIVKKPTTVPEKETRTLEDFLTSDDLVYDLKDTVRVLTRQYRALALLYAELDEDTKLGFFHTTKYINNDVRVVLLAAKEIMEEYR